MRVRLPLSLSLSLFLPCTKSYFNNFLSEIIVFSFYIDNVVNVKCFVMQMDKLTK